MCQVYWERDDVYGDISGKRESQKRCLLKRAPESYAKRVGKSRSQEAGNSSSPKVDQLRATACGLVYVSTGRVYELQVAEPAVSVPNAGF